MAPEQCQHRPTWQHWRRCPDQGSCGGCALEQALLACPLTAGDVTVIGVGGQRHAEAREPPAGHPLVSWDVWTVLGRRAAHRDSLCPGPLRPCWGHCPAPTPSPTPFQGPSIPEGCQITGIPCPGSQWGPGGAHRGPGMPPPPPPDLITESVPHPCTCIELGW